MRNNNRRAGIVAAALALAASLALAEPTAYRLNLEAVNSMPGGKAAFIKGTTTPEGDRFFVEHLMINQPILVRVIANSAADVQVGLAKFRWDEFEQQASTKGSGVAEFEVRTQGEMRLVVQSDGDPAPYYAAVLIGNEIQPEMKPVLVAGSASTGGGFVLWIGIGVVVALIAGFLLLRGRSS